MVFDAMYIHAYVSIVDILGNNPKSPNSNLVTVTATNYLLLYYGMHNQAL